MIHNYTAGNFRLEKSKLFYKNELFLDNCDEIINLALEIGLGNFAALKKLDIENEEEIEWLEKLLYQHVINGSICVGRK